MLCPCTRTRACPNDELLEDGGAFTGYSASGFPDDGREDAWGVLEGGQILLELAEQGVDFAGLVRVEVVLGEGARDRDVDGKSLATAPHWEKDIGRAEA
jgi:hypothetical protein